MRSSISVGIIGLGRSGWNIHAPILEADPGYQVTAVADALDERRREAVDRFRCAAYADYHDLLDDPNVELVLVAAPSHLHAPITLDALRAGKHVLCEKPMALSTQQADEMIAAAKQANRILTVFHNRRFDPDFLKVKEVIDSGKLGTVHLVRMGHYLYERRHDWQMLKHLGGGMLNNWGVHFLDRAMVLLNYSVESVLADMKHTVGSGDADDHVKITLKGTNGMVVDLELTACCAVQPPAWLVLGDHGSLIGSKEHLRWRYYDPTAVPPPPPADSGPAVGRKFGEPEPLPWVEETAHTPETGENCRLFYRRLYEALREGSEPPVTAESARAHIPILEECRRQAGF
ncbi:MAG: Gfo/Idh/MocA family protein [Armatimonadota bacterium]